MNQNNHDDKSEINEKVGEFRSAVRDSAPFLGLGIQLAASMLMFLLLGHLADNYWEISPVGKLIGIFFGFVSIITQVIRIANRFKTEKEKTGLKDES